MPIDIDDLRTLVVRPTLQKLKLHSEAAENLIIGTGITESHLSHLRQMGNGVALGIFQMEPATHKDIWRNFLTGEAHHELYQVMAEIAGGVTGMVPQNMVGNLYYATAMCRVHYLRVKDPLPDAKDAVGLADYWKRWYNTESGAGRAAGAVAKFKMACDLPVA